MNKKPKLLSSAFCIEEDAGNNRWFFGYGFNDENPIEITEELAKDFIKIINKYKDEEIKKNAIKENKMRRLKKMRLKKIKYRGKLKVKDTLYNEKYISLHGDKQRWVYGYYIEEVEGEDDSMRTFFISVIREEYGDSYRELEVELDTIGQWIGFCDREEKEIYTNDTVLFKNIKYRVAYLEAECRFALIDMDGNISPFVIEAKESKEFLVIENKDVE